MVHFICMPMLMGTATHIKAYHAHFIKCPYNSQHSGRWLCRCSALELFPYTSEHSCILYMLSTCILVLLNLAAHIKVHISKPLHLRTLWHISGRLLQTISNVMTLLYTAPYMMWTLYYFTTSKVLHTLECHCTYRSGCPELSECLIMLDNSEMGMHVCDTLITSLHHPIG